MGFFTAYGLNVAAIASVVGAYAYFLGYIDESVAWFAANRQLMVGALIVHFALFALYWRLNVDARELERRATSRKDDDNG